MAPISHTELERLRAAGRRMYAGGLSTGTMGAIGMRLGDGTVAVTAAGARLGFIDGGDLIVLDGNRRPVSSNGREPCADAGVLAAALEAQPEAGSIVRACSPYATALAHRGRRLLEESETLLEGLGGVAFVPYYRPGTAGLAGAVADALRDNRVAVVEAQGPVVWGTDVDDAVDLAEALEAAARVIFILDGGER